MKRGSDVRPVMNRRAQSRLRDERGMLLVIVMVMLLVVSTLAGANLVNSMLERSLAKNQNYASLALQAAEAGVADGITWLNLNQGSIPTPYTANPNWAQTLGPRDLSRDLNGDGDTADPGERLGLYSVTMRCKREWRDYNGDTDCVDPGESSGYQDIDGSPAANCPGDVVLTPYRPMLILHILTGEIMLVAIPFTRLSHMFFFFFTRAYMGSEFGNVRNARDW